MGNKTNHAEPMVPEEILRMSEAFDPTPIGPPGCPCEFCSATSRMKREHAIMRLALEMILAQCKCYTESRAHIVDPIRRTAQQALRECGK